MAKAIAVGDEFTWAHDGRVCRFVRLPDDPTPAFAYERMRVRFVCDGLRTPSYEFPVEPAWFTQRGMRAHEVP